MALLVALALGVGAGLAVAARQAIRFATTGTVVVSPAAGFLNLADADKLPGVTETIVRLAREPAVLEEAASSFSKTGQRPPTIAWIRGHLKIGEVANLSIIEVTGTASSQASATALTRSSVQALADVVNRTAATLHGAKAARIPASGVVVRVFGPVQPQGQISPTRFRNALIGGNAGLLLGVVAALMLGSLRPRLRTAHDVTELLDAPLLGSVRLSPLRGVADADPGITQASARLLAAEPDQGGNVLDLTGGASPGKPVAPLLGRVRFSRRRGVADADPGIIQASAGLLAAGPGQGGNVLVLTGGASPGRLAKVAGALARALSASGRKTIVVDADLARRAFTRQVGLSDHPGLLDILNGNPVQPLDAVAEVSNRDYSALPVIPAGDKAIDPAAELRRRSLPEAIDALRQSHEYVIVIAPEVARAGEVISLARAADSVIVVIEQGIPARRLAPFCDLKQALHSRFLGSLLLR